MAKNAEHTKMIERIEQVRVLLKLNKSRFSASIDLKPQTYNNFIGAQGSKPNIELIAGVIKEFKVNPFWLMFDEGDMFYETFEIGDSDGKSQLSRIITLEEQIVKLLDKFKGI